MRKIELNAFEIPVEDVGNKRPIKMAYSELMILCLQKNDRGFDMKTMMTIMPIIQKIKDAENHVLLEDAEWAILKDSVEVFPFAFPHQKLMEFQEAVCQAGEHQLDSQIDA